MKQSISKSLSLFRHNDNQSSMIANRTNRGSHSIYNAFISVLLFGHIGISASSLSARLNNRDRSFEHRTPNSAFRLQKVKNDDEPLKRSFWMNRDQSTAEFVNSHIHTARRLITLFENQLYDEWFSFEDQGYVTFSSDGFTSTPTVKDIITDVKNLALHPV